MLVDRISSCILCSSGGKGKVYRLVIVVVRCFSFHCVDGTA